jgi:hypothetical protein
VLRQQVLHKTTASNDPVMCRIEVLNLFNTTQFGNPNGVLGSAAFGTITTALDPRVIQLAARCTL